MKETPYQKFLRKIIWKIRGKHVEVEAEYIVNNQDDPRRFERLKALCSDRKVNARLELLRCLYLLESKREKTPFDTWLAILWSGKARIAAPLWAVERFDDIGDAFLYNDGEWEQKNWTLEKAFGFKDWGKKDPDVLKRLRDIRRDGLLWEVWELTLLGFKIKPACLMVARRYQRDGAEKDRKLSYRRWSLGGGEKSGLQEVLRKQYNAWRSSNDWRIKIVERERLIEIATSKENYLQRYPESSLPKASTIKKARADFEKTCSEHQIYGIKAVP